MSIAAYSLAHQPDKMVVIIGLGLIGSTVSQVLDSYGEQHIIEKTYSCSSWDKPITLVTPIKSLLQIYGKFSLDIIWTAGKAGFSATDQQMSEEYDFFVAVITELSKLINIKLTVIFLSSAGGIYENTNMVTHLKSETPSRPYAIWKMKQEQFLVDEKITHRIYRVSSVYGFAHLNARIGLINALLRSANLNQPVMIYANQNTLRDYIYSQDVAKRIVADTLTDEPARLSILASGRTTSVTMLINLVEKITTRRVLVTFSSNTSNDKNIIFSEHLIPKNRSCTSLEEGIRLLNAKQLFIGT